MWYLRNTRILLGISSNYGHFASAWDSVAEEMKTTSNLVDRLIMEENRLSIRNQVESSAFVSMGRGNKFSERRCFLCNEVGHMKRNCSRNQVECFLCGQKGHKKYQCKFNDERNSDRNGTSTRNGAKRGSTNDTRGSVGTTLVAFIGKTENNGKEYQNLENIWILDSGASYHMSKNRP